MGPFCPTPTLGVFSYQPPPEGGTGCSTFLACLGEDALQPGKPHQEGGNRALPAAKTPVAGLGRSAPSLCLVSTHAVRTDQEVCKSEKNPSVHPADGTVLFLLSAATKCWHTWWGDQTSRISSCESAGDLAVLELDRREVARWSPWLLGTRAAKEAVISPSRAGTMCRVKPRFGPGAVPASRQAHHPLPSSSPVPRLIPRTAPPPTRNTVLALGHLRCLPVPTGTPGGQARPPCVCPRTCWTPSR